MEICQSRPNKRMLSDWFSAALQTSRKCGRYVKGKSMFKYILLSLSLVVGSVFAEPILDENKVREISVEFTEGYKNKDISVFEKYMYSGTKIVIDMDPEYNAGEKEISYEEYLKLAKMSMKMMRDIELFEEVLSITVDSKNNQATIEEKTTVLMDMMGMAYKDVSISKTTYGIIDGSIKVISTEEMLVSSGPAQ